MFLANQGHHGNYFTHESMPGKYLRINAFSPDLNSINVIGHPDLWLPQRECQPIKLSDEVFIQMGFQIGQDRYGKAMYHFEFLPFSFVFIEDEFDREGYLDCEAYWGMYMGLALLHKKVRFVHELQNVANSMGCYPVFKETDCVNT